LFSLWPLLAWIYESRFANFNKGLSSEQNFKIQLTQVPFARRASFGCGRMTNRGQRLAARFSRLLSFLESVPDVSAKLKTPITADRKFEEVVKSAQAAAALVLVY
jgi:hypothetical protein